MFQVKGKVHSIITLIITSTTNTFLTLAKKIIQNYGFQSYA